MSDMMTFPDTVEEFMEQYKIVDTKQVYTNGTELIPIFRMKQWFEHLQTIEPERKKDTIQKFHDYQVEWLLAHCDLELEPQLEEWVVRFLHDTANCYMMEMEGEEPEDIPMEYFESGGR